MVGHERDHRVVRLTALLHDAEDLADLVVDQGHVASVIGTQPGHVTRLELGPLPEAAVELAAGTYVRCLASQ